MLLLILQCLTNLLFFDILLLYCYANLNSSIICCLSSGDIYLLFLGLSFVWFCLIICRFFCRGFRKTRYFVSNFLTNQNTSCFCCFLNCSFWINFYCALMMILAIYYHLPTPVSVAAPWCRGKWQKPQPVCGFTYVIKYSDIIVYKCIFKFIVCHTAYDVYHGYEDNLSG